MSAAVLLASVGVRRHQVQRVVGDLERDAEVQPVRRQQRHLRLQAPAPACCPRPVHAEKQERRLVAHDPQVVVARQQRLALLDLEHLTLAHLCRHLAHQAQHLRRHGVHGELERVRIQVIGDEDRHIVAPLRVDGGHSAAQRRLVDHIVVQQRGGVNQLERRRHPGVVLPRVPEGAAGKDREHRAQALALRRADILPHLDHQRGVAVQDRRNVRVNPLQILRKVVRQAIQQVARRLRRIFQ